MESYELLVLNGEHAGQSMPLKPGAIVLGRAANVDWAFPRDPLVSSRHCQLWCDTEACTIVDLSSRNGTFVNARRLADKETLSAGDVIRIGLTEIELRAVPKDASIRISPIVQNFEDTSLSLHIEEPALMHLRSEGEHSDSQARSNSEMKVDQIVRCQLRQSTRHGVGQLCWIALDQSMVIGRSAWTDYPFADDQKMSSKHFRVTLQGDGCIIEDLRSKRGTWVNGQRIERCKLFHGASVLAGDTVFDVELLGIDQLANIAASAPPKSVPPPPPQSTLKMTGLRSSLADNFQRILGNWADQPAPVAWIEKLLLQEANAYLLLDLMRMDLELPEEQFQHPYSLFDWLPAPASRKTPCLFDLRACNDWRLAVDEAWGSDALMVVSSTKSKVELLASLQELLRGRSGQRSDAEGIQGICWPSVLRSMIEVNAHGFAERYFEVVDAVWMEGSDDPLVWDWLGKSTVLEPLCAAMEIRVREASTNDPREGTV
ncbi:MAG: FHA domain-containing protein [Pirellulaceae bacterium]|nr:FHA domain-containing protein [Pirellulaceae bacterium]